MPEFSCIPRIVITFEPSNGFTNCFFLLTSTKFVHRCVRLYRIKICSAYSRFIFNFKIFGNDLIKIFRLGKITKEYYDLKNE